MRPLPHTSSVRGGWESLPRGVREERHPVGLSEDSPELWLATLFHVAWQCPDGTHLRAVRFEPKPRAVRFRLDREEEPPIQRDDPDSPGVRSISEADPNPVFDLIFPAEESSKSFVSPLPIDPFSASVAAIDVLPDGGPTISTPAGKPKAAPEATEEKQETPSIIATMSTEPKERVNEKDADSSWAPASDVWPNDARFTTYKQFRAHLAKYEDEIRTRNPRPNRLDIHAGDWLKHNSRHTNQTFENLDKGTADDFYLAELEERKAKVREGEFGK